MTNPNIEHITANSSNIKTIIYNHEMEELMIEFKYNDKVYCYSNVTEDVIDELKDADSMGSFVAKKIKNVYDWEVV
jgi:hypothetical protein